MTTDVILSTETNETQTPLKAPWRRFFARSLDLGLLATLLNLCLSFFSPMKASNSSFAWMLLETYLSWLFLFLLEPLFLSKWGKTPGKWLFGLSVHQKDGSLLTRSQAFERLVKIFHVGEGYAIPFYSLYRNYKCYEIYTEEGTLPWIMTFAMKLNRSVCVLPSAILSSCCLQAFSHFSSIPGRSFPTATL